MNGQVPSLPTADDELWTLVEAVIAGTADEADRDRLEARLRTEPQARLFYVAYLDIHAHLQWMTRGQSADAANVTGHVEGIEQGASSTPIPTTFRAPLRLRIWRRMATMPGLAIAASAVLAAVLVGTLVLRLDSDDGGAVDFPEAPAGSVAVLIDNNSTRWEKDMVLPTETGSALLPGRLKLKSGVVEIAFHGGSEVLLEGPADFDVSASNSGFLHRGKLVAKVPEGAGAFRVNMPDMVVTDVSGECGLLREASGLTEVHVFEGQVGADTIDRRGQRLPRQRLVENSGIRLDVAQRTLMPVPLNEMTFAGLRPEIRVTEATVRGGQFAARNFGLASRLLVKNSIPDYSWESYLHFDLSNVKGRIRHAVVRLVPVEVGLRVENAAAVVFDNQWGESTITWDNKPISGPEIARWIAEEGKEVEIDVTPYAQSALVGDRKLSLRLYAPERVRQRSHVQYGSRKGDADSRPQLLITTFP